MMLRVYYDYRISKIESMDLIANFAWHFPKNERLSKWRFKTQLENNLYPYSVYVLYFLETRIWFVYGDLSFSVPLPSTLSYGEGRMWQVTAYRHMICISPLCAISCLTHIYSVYLTLNTTLTLYHIYILYLVTTTGRFCELRSGSRSEASMTYPNNEPTTSRDD